VEDFAHPETYTDLNVLVRGAAASSSFDATYDGIVDPAKDALEELAPAREAARLVEVKTDAQATLDENRAEYVDARAEADERFAEVEAELADAAVEIASGEAELADGQAAYQRGVSRLAAERSAFTAQQTDAQALIDAGRAHIVSQQASLDQLAAALPLLQAQVTAAQTARDDLRAAHDAALAEETLGNTPSPSSAELAVSLAVAEEQLAAAETAYAGQSATYEAGVAGIVSGLAELDARQLELDVGTRQAEAGFASAQRTLSAARRTLADGRAELDGGRRELAEGRATFEQEKADAEAELTDALAKLDEAQAEIDDVEMPEWYVLGRDTNIGYANLAADADRIEAIAVVFPFIFFLVSALVALTTMTRMVEEERTLIGTYKALGYDKGAIAAKYLVYAGIASVVGALGGILVGSQVLPRTVWQAYTTMYTAPSMLTPIDVPIALAAGVASVAITLGSTLWAVGATLREPPATLMLPRAPKPGKRIALERVRPVWSRMSFSYKVTARNIFRYKKRLFMTVIGIAGCTALLLTGFGLKNSISDVLAKQYGPIYHYDTIIGFDEGALDAVADGGNLGAALDDSEDFTAHLVLHSDGVRLTNAGDPAPGDANGIDGAITNGGDSGTGMMEGYLSIPQDAAKLPEFIALRERVGGAHVPLTDEGVVITEKIADRLGLSVGDEIRVEHMELTGAVDEDQTRSFTVAGVTEQYVSHFVYMTPALYEDAYGEAPVYNQALAVSGLSSDGQDGERDGLSQQLLAVEGVTTVQFTDDITSSFDDMLESLDSVVYILILSAAILAFIVLYNLTNINVTERQREIATIKVLGFYDAEANAYIYRETALLALLGCALGLVLGVGLEAFVIITAEIDVVMFGREIHTMSYVYSAALTLVFALIVNLAMIPRLRRIDMVESLKSVE
ncbi:MAG: ABC transporter permease, partial [Coriobacteriia bacterium]